MGVALPFDRDGAMQIALMTATSSLTSLEKGMIGLARLYKGCSSSTLGFRTLHIGRSPSQKMTLGARCHVGVQ